MNYKKRFLEKRISEAFNHFPVVAVLGARQVGKSTLIENLFGDTIKTIVFDPVQDIGNVRKNPDFFLQNNRAPLFLDEIQYASELLASIRRIVDKEKLKGRYILSGSQTSGSLSHKKTSQTTLLSVPLKNRL